MFSSDILIWKENTELEWKDDIVWKGAEAKTDVYSGYMQKRQKQIQFAHWPDEKKRKRSPISDFPRYLKVVNRLRDMDKYWENVW